MEHGLLAFQWLDLQVQLERKDLPGQVGQLAQRERKEVMQR
jgi:hypothetical protein